eukprot:11753857-Alexandrium_andersonii.AAC.1
MLQQQHGRLRLCLPGNVSIVFYVNDYDDTHVAQEALRALYVPRLRGCQNLHWGGTRKPFGSDECRPPQSRTPTGTMPAAAC